MFLGIITGTNLFCTSNWPFFSVEAVFFHHKEHINPKQGLKLLIFRLKIGHKLCYVGSFLVNTGEHGLFNWPIYMYQLCQVPFYMPVKMDVHVCQLPIPEKFYLSHENSTYSVINSLLMFSGR